MSLLETINGPEDLKALSAAQMPLLAQEIRAFLVDSVSKTGGHLGPNLGVVELTIALHRVFDSPLDTIVFDTGHQSYVHKLLTGRRDDFTNLRKKGGLSGYPSRAESEHDVVENSHASTALSWADGIAKARRLQGQGHRHTVAVIGDGALTGGMAWEAINNIATDKNLQAGLGVLLVLMGLTFTLQGLGVLQGSSPMTGQTLWAVIGPILALLGALVVVRAVRARR